MIDYTLQSSFIVFFLFFFSFALVLSENLNRRYTTSNNEHLRQKQWSNSLCNESAPRGIIVPHACTSHFTDNYCWYSHQWTWLQISCRFFRKLEISTTYFHDYRFSFTKWSQPSLNFNQYLLTFFSHITASLFLCCMNLWWHCLRPPRFQSHSKQKSLHLD